jgi:hypothetical protein
MPSTYTTNLGIELPADGELDGTWGDVVNENMDILDRAINGSVLLSLSGTSSTLSTTDGTLSNGQFKLLVLGGSPSGTHTITIDPSDAQKIYFVRNTSAQSVVFTQGSGGNVTIAAGDSGVIYSDGGGAGAAVVNITNDFAMSSVKITGGSITGITDLAVADGGTGLSTVPTNGQLLIGNGTGYSVAALTAGRGVTVTNGSGSVTVSIPARAVAASGTSGTLTPNGDTTDVFNAFSLDGGITIAAPSGTPVDGQKLILRFKDNGTARAITWTISSGAYRATGITLPTTTTANKITYVGCVYNSTDSFWDAVALATQA